jgi:hypothetical protein
VDKKFLVTVEWKEKKLPRLPAGLIYITVAKFPDVNWTKEAWSIVLNFDVPPIQQGNPCKATMSFLVKEAPYEKLTKDSKFELYEGKNLVATVRID